VWDPLDSQSIVLRNLRDLLEVPFLVTRCHKPRNAMSFLAIMPSRLEPCGWLGEVGRGHFV